jgi:hypothetical protein
MQWRRNPQPYSTMIVRCLLVVALARNAIGQYGQPISVGACFSNLLRDNYDFRQNTKLKYQLLTFWDNELYEASKTHNDLYTAYGADTFDHSQDKVQRELMSNNVSIDYDRDTAFRREVLDPQASKMFKDCLDSMTSGFGAFTTVINENERYSDVTIRWRGTSGEPLKLRTQEVFNGNVLDDNGTHPRQLFKKEGLFDPEIPSGSSRTVRLERTGPYQQIVIRLIVSPDIGFQNLYIDPVPERVDYTYVSVSTQPGTVDPNFHMWGPQRVSENGNGLQQYDPNPPTPYFHHYRMRHDISELSKDPTAVFDAYHCDKVGAYSDFDGAPGAATTVHPGGSTVAECTGWWQDVGLNATMSMSVTWHTTGYLKRSHTWQAWYTPPSKAK